MAEYKIVKTVELSTLPNSQMARDLLERLRAATAKVVEKRKWRVGVLKEFYPKNKSLLGLNVNRGSSIMIRLRDGDDQFSFLPWHSLLGTLVHELTHNEIGEHSAEFYRAVDKLYDEVEASSTDSGKLWNARSTTTPKYDFEGKSTKVGGGQLAKAVGLPTTNVRQLAAEAAIKRASQTSTGPHVLGGGRKEKEAGQKTPKQLFLEAELKRREQYKAGQGCSVVKSPVAAAPAKGSSSMREVGGAHSEGSRIVSSAAANCGWRWTCHVCTEENTGVLYNGPSVPLIDAQGSSSSSSSGSRKVWTDGAPAASAVCAWCGCVYGSTLDHPAVMKTEELAAVVVVLDAEVGVNKNSRFSGSTDSSSTSSSGFKRAENAEIICIDCEPEISAVGMSRKKRRKAEAVAAGTATAAVEGEVRTLVASNSSSSGAAARAVAAIDLAAGEADDADGDGAVAVEGYCAESLLPSLPTLRATSTASTTSIPIKSEFIHTGAAVAPEIIDLIN